MEVNDSVSNVGDIGGSLITIRRGGAKTLFFVFAWSACWILVPYASVSGKTVFKFRFDIFLVGSQNVNIMCQGQKP